MTYESNLEQVFRVADENGWDWKELVNFAFEGFALGGDFDDEEVSEDEKFDLAAEYVGLDPAPFAANLRIREAMGHRWLQEQGII